MCWKATRKTEDSSQASLVGRDSSQPSRLVHSTSYSGLANQDSYSHLDQFILHHIRIQQLRTCHKHLLQIRLHPKNILDVNQIRIVNAIDSRNNVRKIKVKAKEVLNLTGEERIVVKFDIYDEPFGEAHSLLSRFCGILACDSSLFPINFEKCLSLPVTYFNHVFDHIIKSTQKMRQRNHENRKKQAIPHTGGSKANATRRAEMMVETGQSPGRGQMYNATHKNQDGVYVNEAAKEIYKKIESSLSQSTIDKSQVSPNDVVGKVLGQEYSGRVRCLGLGAVLSRVFQQVRPRFGGTSASSSGGSCSFQCRENYNQILSALKAYMMMKERTIPEQFVGLFDSPSMVSSTAPSDAASGPT
ncbi:hypothetical protein P3L10_008663 [Capsicum annuum]